MERYNGQMKLWNAINEYAKVWISEDHISTDRMKAVSEIEKAIELIRKESEPKWVVSTRFRQWRTLLRVEEKLENGIKVIIPGYNPHVLVFIPNEELIQEENLPENESFEVGGRFFAMVNIGADSPEEIMVDFNIPDNLKRGN